MSNIHKAHDTLFKLLMGRIDVASDFLRIFVPEIASEIYFSTLKLQRKSFVTEKLKIIFSDLIFYFTIKNSQGFIVFLYEHKSQKAKFLYLQLYNYIGAINNFYKQKNKILPVTIPIAFYHGKENFKFPNYEEIISTLEAPFNKFIPKFDLVLFDLYTYGEEYLKKAEDNFILVVLVGLVSKIKKKN